MSDSFADLWNTSAPSKPTQLQPRTLGSHIEPASGQQRKPQNDVFSLLAATSTPSSRSISPSYSPQPVQKASSLGGASPANGAPKPVQKSMSGGDAFGDLLGGFSGGAVNTANMTMAQRAALADKQRQEQRTAHTSSAASNASAWAGLDALDSSSAFKTTKTSAAAAQEDDWGLTFDEPTKPSTSSPAPAAVKVTTPAEDDWGLDDFISKPAPKKAAVPPASQSRSLWDLDEFTSPVASTSERTSPAPQNNRSSTPGSFDFGDREDGLLGDRSDDEEDILGELGKPAQPKPARQVCEDD